MVAFWVDEEREVRVEVTVALAYGTAVGGDFEESFGRGGPRGGTGRESARHCVWCLWVLLVVVILCEGDFGFTSLKRWE